MGEILGRISGPDDVKRLSEKDLPALAAEIREEMIRVIASIGGHFGGGLGVVELTIALHRLFDTSRDRIVWDVGHQAYPHKMLTGRLENLKTIRQWKGLAGFPKPDESEHDAFSAGHAGTSISAALGMAEARDLKGDKYHVIAVVGDGSLTAGMAMEALNQAGARKKNLLVILNDNEMSISENVGALSDYLARITSDPRWEGLRRRTEGLMKEIPVIGEPMARVAQVAHESMVGILSKPGVWFEEMGFRYVGPIDGHDLPLLLRTIGNLKEQSGPILLHVLTVKGKGYGPAEKNPVAFHGVTPFDIETGEIKKKTPGAPTYTKIFGQTMIELGQRFPDLFAITAAMPEGTGLVDFRKMFPDRFVDVGIAEQHAVTLAGGMASQGIRPVAAIYSTFLQRAYDQLVHDICLQNLHVVFALDRGGLVGEDGPTHHGVFDIAYLRHIPNMVVMAPKDENELRHMLYSAMLHDGPIAVRYPRGEGLGVPIDKEFRQIPVGTSESLQEGRDICLLAYGSMVSVAMEAASILREEGIDAGVVNLRFAKPLDTAMLTSVVARYSHIVTLEEGVLKGGVGSAVLEWLASSDHLGGMHVRMIGVPDQYIDHGSPKILRSYLGLTPPDVAKTIKEWLQASPV
jgi:1-deoxy-D-xylulose-5-phosphate synthase|uniref:1-deoxy-D-xylulose-5-phosphate synthase n=1 Tax=Leptospirillum ferriphilum TaxID=178606 RepID=A0A7C3R493_9BACT